jgi:hypothetical protein
LSCIAADVIDDLRAAGMTEDVVPGIIRATYASSGGRMVALVQDEQCWWIAVLRSEGTQRAGASEKNMRSAGFVSDEYPTLVYDPDDGSFS